jgi:hypothetical protein
MIRSLENMMRQVLEEKLFTVKTKDPEFSQKCEHNQKDYYVPKLLGWICAQCYEDRVMKQYEESLAKTIPERSRLR